MSGAPIAAGTLRGVRERRIVAQSSRAPSRCSRNEADGGRPKPRLIAAGLYTMLVTEGLDVGTRSSNTSFASGTEREQRGTIAHVLPPIQRILPTTPARRRQLAEAMPIHSGCPPRSRRPPSSRCKTKHEERHDRARSADPIPMDVLQQRLRIDVRVVSPDGRPMDRACSERLRNRRTFFDATPRARRSKTSGAIVHVRALQLTHAARRFAPMSGRASARARSRASSSSRARRWSHRGRGPCRAGRARTR